MTLDGVMERLPPHFDKSISTSAASSEHRGRRKAKGHNAPWFECGELGR